MGSYWQLLPDRRRWTPAGPPNRSSPTPSGLGSDTCNCSRVGVRDTSTVPLWPIQMHIFMQYSVCLSVWCRLTVLMKTEKNKGFKYLTIQGFNHFLAFMLISYIYLHTHSKCLQLPGYIDLGRLNCTAKGIAWFGSAILKAKVLAYATFLVAPIVSKPLSGSMSKVLKSESGIML